MHMDLLLLICHAFAAFVLYNRNMMFPILTIRVPRLIFRILDTCVLRKGEVEGQEIKRRCPCCQKSVLFIEKWFRAISGICFIALSIAIQFTFIFDDFCDRYVLKENEESCREMFSLVMAMMIIVNTILDYAGWRVCATKFEQEQALEEATGGMSKRNVSI